jgi:hypothetical protein
VPAGLLGATWAKIQTFDNFDFLTKILLSWNLIPKLFLIVIIKKKRQILTRMTGLNPISQG